ncbi:hypothetical protein SAY87_015876 [Trapa incisa]|uniref:U-box domain-containing protein 12 n=1 Tax=Trapa incisa TaxID=236973 RepID=A0AAN7LE65_9MYRT|nr:hypothetical protein SAY87_015876 [Trapa incisa]
MEADRSAVVRSLTETVNEIASLSGYRATVKKQYCNLARRLKLLIPLFEEIEEIKEPLPEETIAALVSLGESLVSAKELLRFGCDGSKVYMVLERDHVMDKFNGVTDNLERALSQISSSELDIADEVKEQVEHVLAQFQRARERVDSPDVQLHNDLLSLYGKNHDVFAESAVLRRLAEKLELVKIGHLKQESIALHEMVYSSDGDPGERIEKMSKVLKKIKDFVLMENPDMDLSAGEKSMLLNDCGQASTEGNQEATVIPDDFRCPISLELMKDPVIVSTGQTYDRSSIEKWLEGGHRTCPKTQQTLTNNVLTPNFVLRSLIDQWCEANGITFSSPKSPSTSRSRPNKGIYVSSSMESGMIESLLHKLNSMDPEVQRSSAGEVRLLAKRSAGNRLAIAEAGAIPLLVPLLYKSDIGTQEHAVTALLNLSICDDNKGTIVFSGAVPGIVHVLKSGSMEARENAAATLFSLSVVDEYKVTIGAFGAIPPLVALLSEGSQRGKKDAATALFNLCIYQGNRGKAVRARIVPTLMQLLTEPGGMVDESLAVLAVLASHPEGRAAIGAAKAVPVLVELIQLGSPRNRENAAAVMVHLCTGDQKHLLEAQEVGVMDPVLDLAENGTDRGKRKAAQLLELLSQFMDQQQQEAAFGGQSEPDVVPPPEEPQAP